MCVSRNSGETRAVKVLKKSQMDAEEQKMLFNEINILRSLDHPNIVKMYEFFEDDKRFYIVTEICKGGELFDEIISRGKFTERDTAILMKQLLMCVNYCHKNNVVHRDLKPENILLESNKDFDQIKIIDFGTSLTIDPSKTLDEKLGTPYYIAPEVLNKKYNHKCDIWSCGVICYIIMSGVPPFNGGTDQEIMANVKKGVVKFSDACWSSISDKAKDFITKLLTMDVNTRVSAEEALKHPWIVEMSASKVDSSMVQGAFSNLKTFRADVKLKQATYAFMASQLLSTKEKENLSKIFKAFDKNGDGKLSKQEIVEGYETHFGKSMDQEEVDALFS
jgi:calcium-dependent protein kinase